MTELKELKSKELWVFGILLSLLGACWKIQFWGNFFRTLLSQQRGNWYTRVSLSHDDFQLPLLLWENEFFTYKRFFSFLLSLLLLPPFLWQVFACLISVSWATSNVNRDLTRGRLSGVEEHREIVMKKLKLGKLSCMVHSHKRCRRFKFLGLNHQNVSKCTSSLNKRNQIQFVKNLRRCDK